VVTRPRPAGSSGFASSLPDLPLFASLSPQARAAISPAFRPSRFERADVLFFEGGPPEWLYVITAGYVKLVKHSDDGREVILHIAMPGDMVGGVSAFGRRPHPFTAQALVFTTALQVSGTEYARVMKDHPDLAHRTVTELVERLTEAHEMAKSLATERVERRIARQLMNLVDRTGRVVAGGVEIAVPLSRQDVADIAGTTVESAIRVLSRWRRAGLVTTIGGRLVVRDLPGLRQVAADEPRP